MGGLLAHLLLAPGWLVLLVVGALVFAEDALFVGFVLPGETAAILAGVSAKIGHAPLLGVWVTVVVAAVAGDTIGYEIGRRHGSRVLGHRALARHRDRLDDAQELLARRGGVAVLVGRWVAFLRAVMPALAGASRMPYVRFAAYNCLGGVLWATTVVFLGYAAGASYARVEHRFGTLGIIMFAMVSALSIVAWRLQSRRMHRQRPIESGSDAVV